MIYDALGEILADAQEFHRKSFPLAKPIQRFVTICGYDNANIVLLDLRSYVDFYAHESAAKCYRLSDRMITDGMAPNHYRMEISLKSIIGTVGNFFEQFKDHGYLTKLAVGVKQLEIRLVCENARIVSIHLLPCHRF